MGDFNPAWFIAIALGFVGLTPEMFPEYFRPLLRRISFPIALGFFLLGIGGLVIDFHAAYELRWPVVAGTLQSPVSKRQLCQIGATERSKIVARLYTRQNIRELSRSRSRVFPFDFQQLFYEWDVSVDLKGSAEHEAFIELTDLGKDDVVRITPETAIISEPLPKWFSGYPEPERHIPDYYARTLRIELQPKQTTAISVRRTLLDPDVPKEQIIGISSMESGSCEASPPRSDIVAESRDMTQQAQSLANTIWNKNAKPVPIRHDPGDVGPNDFQMTIEVWCNDGPCLKRTARQLEVRLGKPLGQVLRH
jgi:hypothetical protein